MSVTILAIAFLVIIGFVAYIGFKACIQSAPSAEEQKSEKCAICRRKFERDEMILRQIGDYKLLYFCRECILKLYTDLGLKN
jgi:hypothetical protein